MFGLIMVLGIVVDDAIIVVENVQRYITQGLSPAAAAIKGTKEVALPVFATVLTNIAAFIPLLFATGLIGEFLSIIPKVAIFALLVSLLEALIIMPSHCAEWMKPQKKKVVTKATWFLKMRAYYLKGLIFSLRNRYVVVISFMLILFLSFFIIKGLPNVMFYQHDTSEFQIRVENPAQSSHEYTRSSVKQIEEIVKQVVPEAALKNIVSMVGIDLTTGDSPGFGDHMATIIVEFEDFENRDENGLELKGEVRKEVEKVIVGPEKLDFIAEAGIPTGKPVDIRILGTDLDTLKEISRRVQEELSNYSGVYGISDDLVWGKPEIRVNVDEQKAAIFGLDTTSVAREVRALVDGLTVAQTRVGKEEMEQSYTQNCVKNINDKFWLAYPLAYHHYTLYYYDRVGNLIETVPPKGVQYLTNLNNRNTAPNHQLTTRYKYNSLQQMVEQQTPDGGTTRFWYDGVGKLRFSQNAQQLIDQEYSYSKYDAFGRVIEVGKSDQSYASFTSVVNLNNTSFPATGSERIYTVYSEPALGVTFQNGASQRYLTGRVSYTYTDEGVKTYYSYDPHGNVEWLIQDLPGLGKNYLSYEYDLVSGNVKRVHYNKGLWDEFIHRYRYDADNRLILVETSLDGEIWDRDAEYSYYDHGPLRRMEIGEDELQGIDYAYTIQSWLKSVNHASLSQTKDPGGDNNSVGNRFAGDAYGMQLNYFTNDFMRSSSPFNSSDATAYNPGTNRNLYNGNISTWAQRSVQSGSSLQYEQLTANQFQYDEVSRLRKSDFNYYQLGWNSTADYRTRYTYDANGNIETLLRHGYASHMQQMDNLSYNYYGGTNRLEYVEDAIASGNYTEDVDDQTSGNYSYDAIGNLTGDVKEGISKIRWTVSGKVKNVERSLGSLWDDLGFIYDASGDRIAKISKPNPADPGTYEYTYYVRDATGNIMATYTKKDTVLSGTPGQMVTFKDQPIYGDNRLGERKGGYMIKHALNPETVATPSKYITGKYGRPMENKKYELSDHLGNVRIVFSDRKLSTLDGSNLPVVNSFGLKLEGVNQYYAFGSLMPGRNYNSSKYRYGYNGKEQDPEWQGTGNSYDYGFRIYNPRIAKFLSVDPLFQSYPWLSTYQFAQNDPIRNIDIDGLEGGSAVEYWATGVGRQLESWWNSWSILPDWSPSRSAPPVKNNQSKPAIKKVDAQETEQATTETAETTTKKSIDLRDKVDFVSQFNSRFGTKKQQNVACCRASKATLSDYGIKNPGPNTPATIIQTAKENNGTLEITENAQAGVDHIDSELEAGNPVLVGVNHTLGNTYNEGTTDHFIVIVGRGTDDDGNTYYNFYEVGTGRENSGTSDNNKLILNSDGSLTGSPDYSSKKQYTVSQVRKNGKQ